MSNSSHGWISQTKRLQFQAVARSGTLTRYGNYADLVQTSRFVDVHIGSFEKIFGDLKVAETTNKLDSVAPTPLSATWRSLLRLAAHANAQFVRIGSGSSADFLAGRLRSPRAAVYSGVNSLHDDNRTAGRHAARRQYQQS